MREPTSHLASRVLVFMKVARLRQRFVGRTGPEFCISLASTRAISPPAYLAKVVRGRAVRIGRNHQGQAAARAPGFQGMPAPVAVSLKAVLAVLYNGLFGTGFAYILWFAIIERLSTAT